MTNTLQNLPIISKVPSDSFNVTGERFFITMDTFLNNPIIKRLGINRDEKLRVDNGSVQGLFEPRADNLNVTLVNYQGEEKINANGELEIEKGDIVVVDANTRRHVWRKMLNEGLIPNPMSFLTNHVLVSMEVCNTIEELERLYETYDSKNSFKTPKNYLESIQERLGLTVKEMTGVTSMMKRSISLKGRKSILIDGKVPTQLKYDELVLTTFGVKYISEFTQFMEELEEKYGSKYIKPITVQRSTFLWAYRALRENTSEVVVKNRMETILNKTKLQNNNDVTVYDKVATYFILGGFKSGGYLSPKASSDKVAVTGGHLYIALKDDDRVTKRSVVADSNSGKTICMDKFSEINKTIWNN